MDNYKQYSLFNDEINDNYQKDHLDIDYIFFKCS